ncbi:tRNA-binding protein [bacterium]|nr:tRNA-binding protein [bacterium]|tara:strand:+ start:76 stop:417 length:342 start_codon:yes stop_codon:yes gene_type:complete
MSISYEEFEQVDIRVGRVVEVTSYEGGTYSTHIIKIDFGEEIGVKKSLARLEPNYGGHEDELVGKQVLAVVNFEPKQIGTQMSEVLTLGFPDENGEAVLVHPGKEVPLGGKFF